MWFATEQIYHLANSPILPTQLNIVNSVVLAPRSWLCEGYFDILMVKCIDTVRSTVQQWCSNDATCSH